MGVKKRSSSESATAEPEPSLATSPWRSWLTSFQPTVPMWRRCPQKHGCSIPIWEQLHCPPSKSMANNVGTKVTSENEIPNWIQSVVVGVRHQVCGRGCQQPPLPSPPARILNTRQSLMRLLSVVSFPILFQVTTGFVSV